MLLKPAHFCAKIYVTKGPLPKPPTSLLLSYWDLD